MFTKKSTWLVLAAATGLLAAACGGDGTDDASSTGSDSDTAHITFMHAQGVFDPAIFDTFREDNPDIQLELQEVPADAYKQQVRVLAQTGDLPDVVMLPGGPDGEALVKTGLPMDLSEALDTPAYNDDGTWRDSFAEGVLEEASRTFLTQDQYADGQQWFVPQSVIAVAAVYNKEIFDELGLTEPTSWTEFEENNDALVAAGYTPLSFVGSPLMDWWIKMAWDQTAPDVTREQVESGEVDFTDPRLTEGLHIVADMFSRGWFPEGAMVNGLEEDQALFLSGRTAQFTHVASTAQYVSQTATFEVGAFALPGVKDRDPVRPVGGTVSNVVVNSESANTDAAIQLAKFLTSAELYDSQVDTYMLSPLATPVEGGDEIYQVFARAIADGSAVSQTWFQSFNPENYTELNSVVYPGALEGDISPEDAGARINELFYE